MLTLPLPAPGFFVLAWALGIYDGANAGDEALAFIEAERDRCSSLF